MHGWLKFWTRLVTRVISKFRGANVCVYTVSYYMETNLKIPIFNVFFLKKIVLNIKKKQNKKNKHLLLNILKWAVIAKNIIPYRSFLTEMLLINLKIRAFWRENKSKQQFSRVYKIERILIFGQIWWGRVICSEGMNGFNCFPIFSTLTLKFQLNMTSLKRSYILRTNTPKGQM